MTKTLIALAATAFVLALAPAANAGFTIPSLNGKSLVQKTCDGEDYADMQEARAEARAEALENGEGYPPRQASVQQSRAPQRASAEPEQPASAKDKSVADASDKTDTKPEIKPATKSEAKSDTKKADDSKKTETKSVASADGSCKKYFSSVGMTLSVPCE